MNEPDVLILGDTSTSPTLRHELPVLTGRPGCYVEHHGARYAVFSELARPHLSGLPNLNFVSLQSLGHDELLDTLGTRGALLESVARACERLGVREGLVPRDFPLDAGDFLRGRGIALKCANALFERRRRTKTLAELDGIRRAQRAAEAAMEEVRVALTAGERSCERLQDVVAATFGQAGVQFDDLIISHGAQAGDPLDFGSGEICPGEPVIVDLWPRDRESHCFADMTRTFCLGPAPAELRRMHEVCLRVLHEVVASIAPGVRTSHLAAIACDIFEQHGFRTFREFRRDGPARDGALHMISHGVGLEIMEEPYVWLDDAELVEGDVLTVEPGLYRAGWGGCRIEDLIHVADGGAETLTRSDYALEIPGN